MVGTRDPFESLFATVAMSVDPASDDGTFVRSLFVARRLDKREFYQRAGEITTHGGFVVHGCLRTYSVDSDGVESIVHFSVERSWVGDIQSARAHRPTLFHVDAIEPSDLLMITLSNFDRLGRVVSGARRP